MYSYIADSHTIIILYMYLRDLPGYNDKNKLLHSYLCTLWLVWVSNVNWKNTAEYFGPAYWEKVYKQKIIDQIDPLHVKNIHAKYSAKTKQWILSGHGLITSIINNLVRMCYWSACLLSISFYSFQKVWTSWIDLYHWIIHHDLQIETQIPSPQMCL